MSEAPQRTYIAIDLKSFYASVECVERGLDPLTTNLLVADAGRTEKTICLAVSPALKAWGIPGRARLFEAVQKVAEVNRERLYGAVRAGKAIRLAEGEVPTDHQPFIESCGPKKPMPQPKYRFAAASYNANELAENPYLELTYIIAPPRMRLYMAYSTRIFNIYLRYVAPEDVHVYSIDECFIDVTNYLKTYKQSARELAMAMIRDVLKETGITATCGIGTNLYLCKIAMDIVAKHVPADADGVRIAELDELSYRRQLWTHTPLTDFWRIGKGIAAKLARHGICTMGDVARCSLENEDLLYKLFGVNAELIIDHAWGYEPCTIAEIKAYRPEGHSLSSGQVLSGPYANEAAKTVVMEMTDALVLDLVDKGLVTDRMVLTVCYDTENCSGKDYSGETVTDRYGRRVPKDAHGSVSLGRYTASSKLILAKVTELYERITDPKLTVRRIYVVADRTVPEKEAPDAGTEQLDLFTDYEAAEAERQKEKAGQQAILAIKKKFGKNAILKGMNFREGATMQKRNNQVGGHKA